MENPRAQRVQQAPVVAHQHDRAVVGLQLPLQLGHALRVQVGGGLVGQQQVAALGQRRCNSAPGALAAGQALAILPGAELRAQPPIAVALHVAHLADDRDLRIPPDHALLRRELAGENRQQRGFARAVFADQADALAIVDLQLFDVDHPARAKAVLEVRGLQQNFRHKKSLLPPSEERTKAQFRCAKQSRNLQTATKTDCPADSMKMLNRISDAACHQELYTCLSQNAHIIAAAGPFVNILF